LPCIAVVSIVSRDEKGENVLLTKTKFRAFSRKLTFHEVEFVLALEDGEEAYWMRLRRACAGGEPASASLSTIEKWSSPWRTERKPIG
jgi:hypothetical protein